MLNRLFGTVLLGSIAITYCSAQVKKPQNPAHDSEVIEKTRQDHLQTVLGFIDRAKGFSDLDSRVNTLVRLGELLWQQKGKEDVARQLFLQLNDQLKLAASTQSTLDSSDSTPASIARLRQLVLRYLARYDAKLAKELFLEQTQEKDSRFASTSLELATGLAMDGSVSAAQQFAEQSIDSGFSGLNPSLVIGFLHQLRLRDGRLADALFVKVVYQFSLLSNASADNLLLIGNYLFINDLDVREGSIRFTPTQIGNVYFSVGISGERSGLSTELVRTYLRMGLAVLTRQLPIAASEGARRRYEAAARLLELKAVAFAPELAEPFGSVAGAFASSPVKNFGNLESESEAKLIDYETSVKDLEKIADTNSRDGRCLGLVATAYRQNDLDTASKLTDLLNDLEIRARVRDLITFRRAANFLAKGDVPDAEKAEQRVVSVELRILLELGLADLELKNKNTNTALGRLQRITASLIAQDLEARPLYLLTIASLLASVHPTLAIQALSEALKGLNNSTIDVAELSKRDGLAKVTIGKKTAFFSLNSKEIPFVGLEDSLRKIYHQSPQDTMTVVLNLKNERVLGSALVLLSEELLGTGATPPKEAKKA